MVASASSARCGMERCLAGGCLGLAGGNRQYHSFLVCNIAAFVHIPFHGDAVATAADLEICHCQRHFATRRSLLHNRVAPFLCVAAFFDSTTSVGGTMWCWICHSTILFAPLPQTADLFQANVHVGSSETTCCTTVLRSCETIYIQGNYEAILLVLRCLQNEERQLFVSMSCWFMLVRDPAIRERARRPLCFFVYTFALFLFPLVMSHRLSIFVASPFGDLPLLSVIANF